MENTSVICKTDAEILIDFITLKDSGFVFHYAKKEAGVFQQYINCNGKVFGPYEKVMLSVDFDGIARWSVWQGDFIFEYENNGKECVTIKTDKENNKPITQEEIDRLLSGVDLDEDFTKPKKVYDKRTHILYLNRKKQYFVVGKKKYGPYKSIHFPCYLKKNCFHFIFSKRNFSDNWYYNFNGKEIGPFSGDYGNCFFDGQGRAVVDELKNYNFILRDGKKIKCFNEKYHCCRIIEENGHQIIIGEEPDEKLHFKRDGIQQDFPVRKVRCLDNGDVVYSKIQDDTETWFYNDKQISVSINGYSSEIFDSIIAYKRKEYKDFPSILYFMKNGKEYNGMYNPRSGFVLLDEGAIQFLPWEIPDVYRFEMPDPLADYEREKEGMYLRFFNTGQLAGRD